MEIEQNTPSSSDMHSEQSTKAGSQLADESLDQIAQRSPHIFNSSSTGREENNSGLSFFGLKNDIIQPEQEVLPQNIFRQIPEAETNNLMEEEGMIEEGIDQNINFPSSFGNNGQSKETSFFKKNASASYDQNNQGFDCNEAPHPGNKYLPNSLFGINIEEEYDDENFEPCLDEGFEIYEDDDIFDEEDESFVKEDIESEGILAGNSIDLNEYKKIRDQL